MAYRPHLKGEIMRKFINIVGVGNRIHGTSSKTGKPYDFTPVSFTYEDNYTTGLKAANCNLAQDCCPQDYRPCVGETVEAFMREDFKTGRVYIEGVC